MAPPIRRWTTRRRAVSAPIISAPFPIFFSFELWRKNNEAGNFLNAVEREPVETRALNPTASEASYKPKQRSYRTKNLRKKVPAPKCPAPQRRRRNVPDPWIYTPIQYTYTKRSSCDNNNTPIIVAIIPANWHTSAGISTNDTSKQNSVRHYF